MTNTCLRRLYCGHEFLVGLVFTLHYQFNAGVDFCSTLDDCGQLLIGYQYMVDGPRENNALEGLRCGIVKLSAGSIQHSEPLFL